MKSLRLLSWAVLSLLIFPLAAASNGTCEQVLAGTKYLCRVSRDLTKVTSPGIVRLADQFEPNGASFRVGRSFRLCSPAEEFLLDDECTVNTESEIHLKLYTIGRLQRDTRIRPTIVRTEDQFGVLEMEVGSALSLMVPTAKNLSSRVPPQPSGFEEDFEHFTCYPIRLRTTFKPVSMVLDDQFEDTPRDFVVTKPTRLCVPTEKTRSREESESIRNPDRHLLCYFTEPRMDPQRATTNNQFGPETLALLETQATLCVPAMKTVIGERELNQDLPDIKLEF